MINKWFFNGYLLISSFIYIYNIYKFTVFLFFLFFFFKIKQQNINQIIDKYMIENLLFSFIYFVIFIIITIIIIIIENKFFL